MGGSSSWSAWRAFERDQQRDHRECKNRREQHRKDGSARARCCLIFLKNVFDHFGSIWDPVISSRSTSNLSLEEYDEFDEFDDLNLNELEMNNTRAFSTSGRNSDGNRWAWLKGDCCKRCWIDVCEVCSGPEVLI